MNFFSYNLNTAYAKYLKALQGRKMARITTGYAAMHAHKHARKHTHTPGKSFNILSEHEHISFIICI